MHAVLTLQYCAAYIPPDPEPQSVLSVGAFVGSDPEMGVAVQRVGVAADGVGVELIPTTQTHTRTHTQVVSDNKQL